MQILQATDWIPLFINWIYSLKWLNCRRNNLNPERLLFWCCSCQKVPLRTNIFVSKQHQCKSINTAVQSRNVHFQSLRNKRRNKNTTRLMNTPVCFEHINYGLVKVLLLRRWFWNFNKHFLTSALALNMTPLTSCSLVTFEITQSRQKTGTGLINSHVVYLKPCGPLWV